MKATLALLVFFFSSSSNFLPSALGFAPTHKRCFTLSSSSCMPRPATLSPLAEGLAPNDDDNNTKTSDEINFIQTSLTKNILFERLSDSGMALLVQGMQRYHASNHQVIVRQGDASDHDYVYLVAEGTCKVKVDGTLVPQPYHLMQRGDVFGELGVLYSEDRGATITATCSPTILYRIAAPEFKTILLDKSQHLLQVSLETMQQVDWAINKVEGTIFNYGGAVIPTYQPERTWLWQQFEGTILPMSIPITLANVVFSVVFCLYAKTQTVLGGHDDVGGDTDWLALLAIRQLVPDKSLPFVERLTVVHQVWEYQKGLTTFILTFFLNVAFGIWKDCYNVARDLQGRLDDFLLLLSTNVERNPDGSLTKDAQKVLDDVGQYSRLFHILVWASLTDRFAPLATPYGLERMKSRGLITSQQCEVLQTMDVPTSNLHYIPLEWMMIRVNQAMANGTVASDTAVKGQFLTQTRMMRNDPSVLVSKLAGRMPLPYVHLVQILVDSVVLFSPLALYADLGDYSVIAVAILTLFYTGLLNLAKIFLDPLNNEKYCGNSIFMDLGVLMRESNAGSVGWKNAGAKLPFP